MQPAKESVQCIPVLPVKSQIEEVAFDIKLNASDISYPSKEPHIRRICEITR